MSHLFHTRAAISPYCHGNVMKLLIARREHHPKVLLSAIVFLMK